MINTDSEPVEYLDVLDDNGNKTGATKPRSEVHRDGDWHRVVHVWVVNGRGEILLQRRSEHKYSDPGKLDISVAGHIQAGDEPIQSAIREVKEEIGLDIAPSDLREFAVLRNMTNPRPGMINNDFSNCYILHTDKEVSDMTMQEEEVAELMFVPLSEFKKMISFDNPGMVQHPVEYRMIAELVEAELTQ